MEDGQLSYDEATELCEAFDCPVAEVFRAALRRWGRPMFEVEQAVMDAEEKSEAREYEQRQNSQQAEGFGSLADKLRAAMKKK